MNIKEYLKNNRIIADGAMGTYYASKYADNGLTELANIEHPERIREIHEEYVRAGANLLRTNTFAANTMFLDSMDEVRECIKRGFEIATEVADSALKEEAKSMRQPGHQVYVAADIGPVYEIGIEDENDVLNEYREICDTFLECGAEVFVMETFSDFQYVEPVSRYIKEKKPEAFVIAQFSFDKSGYTKSGLNMKRVLKTASGMSSLDAYGMNCGVEALHLYQMIKDISFPNDKYITALPNAGYPMELRGKTVYANNADYFVEMSEKIADLGVDIQGGCCGTSPEYIRRLSEGLKNKKRPEKRVGSIEEVSGAKNKSDFSKKLESGKKMFVVELDPPFNTDVTKVMENAQLLKKAGADVITLSDSPMARARMDAQALAAKVYREIQIPVMPHICCRDRNLISLRATMLGNHMNGIMQYLVVTGDPVSRDAEGTIKPVFNVNSIRFMQYLKNMNEDVFENESVVYGGALNYHGANPDAIIERIHKKEDAGCLYLLTQPVYSDEDVERLRYIKAHIRAKLMCGIMPLVSYKNATFVKNEMPGIYVPDEIIEKYELEMTREDAEKTAVEISVEIAEKMKDFADGYYLMTPFNRGNLIAGIMDEIRRKEGRQID